MGSHQEFSKQHRERLKGIQEQCISFGKFGIQALESAWISSGQIGAGRRAITATAGRAIKIWIRIFADKPVTKKPIGTRMGKGKGGVAGQMAGVKRGQILYEMDGVSEAVARKAAQNVGYKMSIPTRFLKI